MLCILTPQDETNLLLITPSEVGSVLHWLITPMKLMTLLHQWAYLARSVIILADMAQT